MAGYPWTNFVVLLALAAGAYWARDHKEWVIFGVIVGFVVLARLVISRFRRR